MFADPCRKSLNKNDWDQVLWARVTEHPTQNLVFTKPLDTTTWLRSLLSKVFHPCLMVPVRVFPGLLGEFTYVTSPRQGPREAKLFLRNNEAQGLDMLRPKSFQLALAVQTLDSAIHRINHYPSDRSPWSRASISTDFLSQPLPSSMPPDPPRYSCFSDHGLLAKVKAPA